jgi:L-lactate dehydrogenase complex protein LldG
MMPESDAAREEILSRVRASLGRDTGRGGAGTGGVTPPLPSIPPSARIPSRAAGEPESELELLLGEIAELGGHARRLAGAAVTAELVEKDGSMAAAVQRAAGPGTSLAGALAELVEAEQVRRAAIWQTPQLRAWGLAEKLASLGVEVAPPDATLAQIATCDLGVTGVDAALPETGSLLLRSGPDRPRTASLLPRVHLALLTPGALRGDMVAALKECRGVACATLITGPSRTSDIELTLTIGVHGPKALYVWVL